MESIEQSVIFVGIIRSINQSPFSACDLNAFSLCSCAADRTSQYRIPCLMTQCLARHMCPSLQSMISSSRDILPGDGTDSLRWGTSGRVSVLRHTKGNGSTPCALSDSAWSCGWWKQFRRKYRQECFVISGTSSLL